MGKELPYLWTAMCSPMHSEHSNYIQSVHICLINYWEWVVQWLDSKLCWGLVFMFWVWATECGWEGGYLGMDEFWGGKNDLDDLECDKDWLKVLVYFLWRKFWLVIAVDFKFLWLYSIQICPSWEFSLDDFWGNASFDGTPIIHPDISLWFRFPNIFNTFFPG